MTDIYTSEAAARAAFELVDALIKRITDFVLAPDPDAATKSPEEKAADARREILLAAEDAIAQLEIAGSDDAAPPAIKAAAKLIRSRYTAPDAPTT